MKKEIKNETKINFNVKATKLYIAFACLAAVIIAILVLASISLAGVNKLEKKTVPGIYKQTASKIDSLNSNIDKSINSLEGKITTRFDELNNTLANYNRSIENSLANLRFQNESLSKLMGTSNDTNNTVFGRLNAINGKLDAMDKKLDTMDYKLDLILAAVVPDADTQSALEAILTEALAYIGSNPNWTIEEVINHLLAAQTQP